MRCSWCGKEIIGEAFAQVEGLPMTWGDGEVEVEVAAGYDGVFCCAGCEWVFELDQHRLLGYGGREARRHLIEVHGISPGKPGGRQSRESWDRSAGVARAMMRIVYGREDVGHN